MIQVKFKLMLIKPQIQIKKPDIQILGYKHAQYIHFTQ